MTDVLHAGFLDAPRDSARAFRPVLEALSRPGRVISSDANLDAPILSSAAALCLTLCDYDTPLWIASSLRSSTLVDYLKFHTGAPLTHDIGSAAFLLCDMTAAMEALEGASIGTAEYPDRSATLIIITDSMEGGAAAELSGPGIETVQLFAPHGADLAFWHWMQRNHQRFPLGIDVIFASTNTVAAIPRSTRISIPGVA
ncbi:phosphonate C-P lyase system protein PhnH [soil metagenome]